MPTIYLIRGLPSTGKTTLADQLTELNIAADDYFYKHNNPFGVHVIRDTEDPQTALEIVRSKRAAGCYEFDPKMLPKAHKQCLDVAKWCLSEGHDVAVHNTFTCRWELEPYLEAAMELESQVTIIDLWDGGCEDAILHERNQHGVPLEAFERMRERYEHDWKAGDPRPPWERK